MIRSPMFGKICIVCVVMNFILLLSICLVRMNWWILKICRLLILLLICYRCDLRDFFQIKLTMPISCVIYYAITLSMRKIFMSTSLILSKIYTITQQYYNIHIFKYFNCKIFFPFKNCIFTNCTKYNFQNLVNSTKIHFKLYSAT